jgi:hypothetical protein
MLTNPADLVKRMWIEYLSSDNQCLFEFGSDGKYKCTECTNINRLKNNFSTQEKNKIIILIESGKKVGESIVLHRESLIPTQMTLKSNTLHADIFTAQVLVRLALEHNIESLKFDPSQMLVHMWTAYRCKSHSNLVVDQPDLSHIKYFGNYYFEKNSIEQTNLADSFMKQLYVLLHLLQRFKWGLSSYSNSGNSLFSIKYEPLESFSFKSVDKTVDGPFKLLLSDMSYSQLELVGTGLRIIPNVKQLKSVYDIQPVELYEPNKFHLRSRNQFNYILESQRIDGKQIVGSSFDIYFIFFTLLSYDWFQDMITKSQKIDNLLNVLSLPKQLNGQYPNFEEFLLKHNPHGFYVDPLREIENIVFSF